MRAELRFRLLADVWRLSKKTVTAFVADGVMSRGAAVAFYAVTSLAPLLLIVTAIAGLAFGQDVAQRAIAGQFQSLIGQRGAQLIQTVAQSASQKGTGTLAAVIGLITLLATASGVFGEIQASLNAIWKAQPRGSTFTRVVKARMVSLGLVGVLGFLLLVSLVISAGLTAFGAIIDAYLPFGTLILGVLNNVLSVMLLTALFAAIYKIMPDIKLAWGDVVMGAFVTSILFVAGKSLIGLYLGSSAIASAYGAASAPIALLLWIYYSSQIFFIGAEFTRIYAEDCGSLKGRKRDRGA
jgi:membrane protein